MTYYNNKIELGRFIDNQIEKRIDIDIKQIYVYALRKWGFGNKLVDNYLRGLENVGEIRIEHGILKAK